MSVQFKRYCQLTLVNDAGTLQFDQLRIRFQITAGDVYIPNVAVIRVYNLTDDTILDITQNYRGVILDAGYGDDSRGTIFLGDVKQYKFGKENNIDRYLEIYAADGGTFYTSATMRTSISADNGGATQEKILSEMQRVGGLVLDPTSAIDPTLAFGGTLPRGRVLYGMVRDQIGAYSKTQGARWYFDKGRVVITQNSTYRQTGEELVLNAETGLIGYPEATDEGIAFTCLINPRLTLGAVVQLDNRFITQFMQRTLNIGVENPTLKALRSTDGRYKVIVIDYVGDTRGNEWYCNVACLALRPAARAPFAVDYGGDRQ